MTERSYLQHGRRHGAAGSDPIPDIISVAAARTTSDVTCPGDNAQHYFSLQDGSSANFQTNDGGVFANEAFSPLGSPIYGVQVLIPGLYRYEWCMFVSDGTAGVKFVGYQTTENGILSNFQPGRTGILNGDSWDANSSPSKLFWTEYVAYDDTQVPSIAAPWGQLVSGSDVSIAIQVFVTRLNSFYFDLI